ncbi:unnamed protein product [Lampetra planeri]
MGRESRRWATRTHGSRRARVTVEADGADGGGSDGGDGGGHAVSLRGLLVTLVLGLSRLLGRACAVVQRVARWLGGLLLLLFLLRGAEDGATKRRKAKVRPRHRCVPPAVGPRDHVETSHGQQQQEEAADASSEPGSAEEEVVVPQGPEDVVAIARGSEEEEVLVVVEDTCQRMEDDDDDDEVPQKLEEEMVRGMEAMPQSLEMIGMAREVEEVEEVEEEVEEEEMEEVVVEKELVVVEEEEEEMEEVVVEKELVVVEEEGGLLVEGNGVVVNLPWFADLDPPEPEVVASIIEEVERMLSNEALSRDPFLLKHVRRNGPGYVSVKLLTSLRGVRRLTRDWRVSSLALRRSSHLQLNAAGTKVRRLDSLPTHLLAPPASPGAAALSGGDGDTRQTSPPLDVCAAGLGSPGPRAGAAEGSGGSGSRQSMATQCGLDDEGSSACSELHGDDGDDDDCDDGGAEGQQRAASSGGALRLGGPGAGSPAVAVVLARDAISVGTQTPCDPSPVGRADFDYDVWVNEWPCCDRDVYGGGYDDVCDCSDDSDDGGDGDGGGICEVMAYSPWVVRHRLAALRAARSKGAGAIGAGYGGCGGGGGGSARLSSSPRILRLPRGPDGTGGFAQRGAVAGQQPAVATAAGGAVGEAAAIYVDGDRWDLSWGPGLSSSLH